MLSSSRPTVQDLKLRIGTRGSPLALAQARELRRRLAAAHGVAEEALDIVVIKTTGDIILDRALSEAGGKGLFTKELDLALMRGEIGIAVHSAKDLPTQLPDEIAILGYLPREDVRDAWISPHAQHPLGLAAGSVVGTASLRRGAIVRRLRPDLNVVLLRGNVETRLAKLAGGEVDATLLALAGLKRLGLEGKASALLNPEEFVPAAGQGAIAITARTGDDSTRALIAPILDQDTGLALAAERAFLAVLDGSCKTPIGAYARLEGGRLIFHALVLKPDGSACFEARVSGEPGEAIALGEGAGRDLISRIPPDLFED
ncbi:hydroxymethylbilane synthase [Methylocella silvestris]|uniref:Porphobilinogen deaminase n=1 Tax=Methylocella silvestris TaxID=199596 RepID=A0A2J7TMD6_METSI|nr:hydroxymethylbilane synthase [Methylocella silvestris]PNG27936.1 hydroxymethylbilane synthase [Methylocella silvestris]